MKKALRRSLLALALVLLCLPALTAGNGVTLASGEQPHNDNDKLIALTFDDGPGAYTDWLLDELKERDIRSTFFLLGQKVARYEAQVKRMREEGHLIGSHTWSHKRILFQSSGAIREELYRTDEAIRKACGETPRFFRPPHGAFFDGQLQKIGKFTILWSYDTVDWKHKNADTVYHNILAGARDGAILLMHDIHKTTVQGVLRAIDDLVEQGYTFVRVDELLQRNGRTIEEGRAYTSCRFRKKPRTTHLPFVISVKQRLPSDAPQDTAPALQAGNP